MALGSPCGIVEHRALGCGCHSQEGNMSQQTSHHPLAGRVALVTGASGGLGSAIARDLAAKGGRLVLTARRVDALESAAAALRANGAEVVTPPADMASRDAVIQLA